MAQGRTDLEFLEARLSYTFKDRSLLERALIHPSWTQQMGIAPSHNQRLEFLGDAVLGLAFAELLFQQMPEEREGVLTRSRAMLVQGARLAALAREIELPAFLCLGDGEEANDGRERDSILEDAFEALIGAIYLDGQFESALRIIEHLYGDLKIRLESLHADHNPKGRLQELIQPTLGNEAIDYRLIGQFGPDHRKKFEVEIWIEGESFGKGKGSSKKEAEESAAKKALLCWLKKTKTTPPV